MTDIPRNNNFDLLRLLLAFTVSLAHLGDISGVVAFYPLSHHLYSGVAVECFFVVSGFLIFRSYHRSSTLFSYLNKRLRRIYPAYLTVVLLAAVLLPLITGTASDLLFSREWFRYLLTNLAFLNFLQPDLPGIFSGNNLQVINAPLWTIKVEVMFYLLVPLLFLFLRDKRKWLPLTLLYGASIAYSLFFLHLHASRGADIYLTLEKQLPGQLAFFLSGGAIYFYFKFFKKQWKKLLPAALLLLFVQPEPLFALFYPLALAIAVLSFALTLPYLGNWGKYGDFSYGVYIFHFPIIQLFSHFALFDHHPWISFVLLLLTIFFTAFCSYHLVERPFLRKSSHYRLAAESKKTS